MRSIRVLTPSFIGALGLFLFAGQLASQDTTAVQSGSTVSGIVFGVPGNGTDPAPEFFTLGYVAAEVPSRGIGLEYALGTMPRALISGIATLGGRGAVLVPIMVAQQDLVFATAGVAGVVAFGQQDSFVEPAFHLGAAAVFAKRNPGLRIGITWQSFRDLEESIWLFEIGLAEAPTLVND